VACFITHTPCALWLRHTRVYLDQVWRPAEEFVERVGCRIACHFPQLLVREVNFQVERPGRVLR
jgi:hypothetical protein